MTNLNSINGPITPISRKTVSKVSLTIGETFKGELISIEGDEALILLPGGARLRARIIGDLKEGHFSKFLFQIAEFKEGTAFLKIIQEEVSEELSGSLENKLLKEGIAHEDKDMALILLKHNIPLTKNNLSLVKSIISLWSEGIKGEEYINKLIDKYINLKEDAFAPLTEGEARSNLKEAFKGIASLSKEDIIIFLENDMALSKDNIEAYKKLYTSKDPLFTSLKGLVDKGDILLKDDQEITNYRDTSEEFVHERKTEHSEGREKAYLKSNRDRSLNQGDYNKAYKVYDSGDKDIKRIVEKLIYGNGKASSHEIKPKEIESNGLIEELSQIEGKEEGAEVLGKIEAFKGIKEEVMMELIGKGKELRAMIKGIINRINEDNGEKLKEELQLSTNTIGNFHQDLESNLKEYKLLNHLSKEYYYCDIPLNLFKKEFPVKLIIKDHREGGKSLDSKEFKLVVSVASPNLGRIDCYLETKDKNMKINITAPEKATGLLEKNSEILVVSLKSLGYNTAVQVLKKEEEIEVSPLLRFFQEDNSILVDALV